MRICLVRPWRRSLGTLEMTEAAVSALERPERLLLRIQTWQRIFTDRSRGQCACRLRIECGGGMSYPVLKNLSRSSILNELRRSKKMRSGYRFVCFTAAPDFPERIADRRYRARNQLRLIFLRISISLRASASSEGTRRRKDCNRQILSRIGRGCGRGDQKEPRMELFWRRVIEGRG